MEIISYFINLKPIETAVSNYPQATLVAHFIYLLGEEQNSFHFYLDTHHNSHSLLSQLKLFNPVTLTFQNLNDVDQENLTDIYRTPPKLHSKNPFIFVSFSAHPDPSRHWCSPTDIPNPPRITIFENKTNPLPSSDTLYLQNHLIQFTSVHNTAHRSFGSPAYEQ